MRKWQHSQNTSVRGVFDDISFVSWKIKESLTSYTELQNEVALISHQTVDPTRFKEMKAFVSKEFDCTLWKDIFSKNTLQTLGIKQEPTEKKQKQIFLEQKNNVKNILVEHVANKLVVKGKQYSTYVSQSWPHYEECIRFPVHVDDYADISQKIPFSLIHGYLEHLGIMH